MYLVTNVYIFLCRVLYRSVERQRWRLPPSAVRGHRSCICLCFQFKDVVMRYSPDLPPALNGVSFATRSREKIGIVGRTGGGKSSLGVALFRIAELSSGSIMIDGVPISSLSLDQLRSCIAIIPQARPLACFKSLCVVLLPVRIDTALELDFTCCIMMLFIINVLSCYYYDADVSLITLC